MNCNEARAWSSAHLDGELDLMRDAEIAEHVRGCPGCAAMMARQQAWQATLRRDLPRWTPPPALEQRVRTSLRVARGGEAPATRRPWWMSTRWIGTAAAMAAVLAVGFVWGDWQARRSSLGEELIGAHVLALTDGHLTDVTSSDRHTVKPWLAQHLDFSPPVVDLASAGFPLIGGRVERLDGRAVAALVYQRRRHVITVYVAPADGGGLPGAGGRRGYRLRSWRAGEFGYVAVSDVAEDELAGFVAALQAAGGPG